MLCSGLTCGAVCVYPNRVGDCVASLKAAGASHIPVASGTVNHLPHVTGMLVPNAEVFNVQPEKLISECKKSSPS